MRFERIWGLALALLTIGLVGGSVPEPATTYALLSDQVAQTAGAGAGVLALGVLTPEVGGEPVATLTLADDEGESLAVSTTGTLRWALSVELLPAEGAVCTGLGAHGVSVAVAREQHDVVECGAAQVVEEGTGPWRGTVVVRPAGGDRTQPWEGQLRLTLQQQPGGFDDRVDVPVAVGVDPGGAAAQTGATHSDPPAGTLPSSAGTVPSSGGAQSGSAQSSSAPSSSRPASPSAPSSAPATAAPSTSSAPATTNRAGPAQSSADDAGVSVPSPGAEAADG